MKRMLDFAIYALPVIGGILLGGFSAAALYSGRYSQGLWLGVAGVICFLLLGAIYTQKYIWESKTAQLDQNRAYVYAYEGDVVHIPGSPPTVSVQIKNTGKTPALELTWRATFVVTPPSEASKIVMDQSLAAPKNTLPPGGIFSYKYTFITWDPKFDEMLKNETAAIFAVGEIRYKDTSGNDHFTDYRLMSGGNFGISTGIAPGKFGPAAEGNNSN